jgi:hypothetical protein
VRDHHSAVDTPGVLPLRPLTTGEVLDAAVVLLRTHATRLFILGLAVALAEQAILFPLRRLADVDLTFLPDTGRLGPWGALVVVGVATEALAIGVLGASASAYAPQALLGLSAPRVAGRVGALVIALPLVALLCASSASAFLLVLVPLQVAGIMLAGLITVLLWVPTYGLLGLVAPAVVIDRQGPARAVRRSVRLASRTGLRAALIRVLGYLSWLLVRLALTMATVTLISVFYVSPSTTVDNVIMAACALVVNALAYPVLGCLDAALHLEVRMRTEGLDIALRRSLHRGVATESALAVPTRVAVGQPA